MKGRFVNQTVLAILLICQSSVCFAVNDPTEPTDTTQSAELLHSAVEEGDLKQLKSLMDKGGDINARDENGIPLLHHALRKDRKEIAQFLVAKGADVNGKDKWGHTPLYYGIWNKDADIVELLVDKGADVTIKDRRGRTPVDWARQRDHTEVIDLLLSKKADISSALLSAAQNGDREFVEQLLDLGADVNVQDKLGLTPLHIAASRQDKEIVAFLLAHNAKVNVQDKAQRLPLHYAVGARHPWWEPKDEDIETAVLLLNHGADVNTPDKEGKTPLYYSVRLGKKMTELLLNRGADPNYVDPRGEKPLPSEHGHTFYVATDGDDSKFGTLEQPLRSVNAAIMVARPGDTIYVRDGTHSYSHTILIEKSGKQDKPIRLSAYPTETPVFDFSSAPGIGFLIRGAYWHIKGIVITKSGTEGLSLTGEGAHHNIVEQVVSHSTGRTGITVNTKAAQNIILNCDAYRNFDFLGNGENADGFEVKFSAGIGNILIGNRSWNNADDGYDFWDMGETVRLEQCYAWRNGENLWDHPFFTGNGNGFKLGRGKGRHIVINCVAWNHHLAGFNLNGNETGVILYACTAVDNFINYHFYNPPVGAKNTVLRNNLSYKEQYYRIAQQVDSQFNSWDSAVNLKVTEDDFVTVDDGIMSGPRNPDGSIPQNDFFKLAPGSVAIDTGVDVNMPFIGKAPDLGAFEYRPAPSKSYIKMLHQHVRDYDLANVGELLAKGENVNAKDWLGYAPLHWAVYFGYLDVAELLLDKGAAPNLKSDTGRTPLEIASEMAFEEIVELLRKHGATNDEVVR